MAAQGATLQNYNNELVKSIEDLREKREELNRQILSEEEDKAKKAAGADKKEDAKFKKQIQKEKKISTALKKKLQVAQKKLKAEQNKAKKAARRVGANLIDPAEEMGMRLAFTALSSQP